MEQNAMAYLPRTITMCSLRGLLLVAIGLQPACSLFGKKDSGGGGGSAGTPAADSAETEEPGDTPGDQTADAPADGETGEASENSGNVVSFLDKIGGNTIKVRNYSQVYTTFLSLTAIPETDETVSNYFQNNIATNLPTLNDADGFLGSHQLAATKFAAFVCDHAYQNRSVEERVQLFGVDTSDPSPIQVFGGDGVKDLSETMISNFWGTAKDDIDPKDVDALETLMDEQLLAMDGNDPRPNDADMVRYGIVGVCTAVLAAAPVLFY